MAEWAETVEVVSGVLGWTAVTEVVGAMRRAAEAEALCLIGMSAETLTEQAARTEADAPSMGLAEVEIAAAAENSAVAAGLAEMPRWVGLAVEMLPQAEATEVLAEY